MVTTYQCSYCAYMTTRLYNLNRHIKTVHKVNDEDYLSKSTPRHCLPYHCTHCQYTSTRAYNFKRHSKNVHNIIIEHNHNNSNLWRLDNSTSHCLNGGYQDKRNGKRMPIVITSKGSFLL